MQAFLSVYLYIVLGYIGLIAVKLALVFGYIYFSGRNHRKLLKRYKITPLVCFLLNHYRAGLTVEGPAKNVLCAVTETRLFFFNEHQMIGNIRKDAIADTEIRAAHQPNAKSQPIKVFLGPRGKRIAQQHPEYPDDAFDFNLVLNLVNGTQIIFLSETYSQAIAERKRIQKLVLRPIRAKWFHIL